jgi:hypothetical protein
MKDDRRPGRLVDSVAAREFRQSMMRSFPTDLSREHPFRHRIKDSGDLIHTLRRLSFQEPNNLLLPFLQTLTPSLDEDVRMAPVWSLLQGLE